MKQFYFFLILYIGISQNLFCQTLYDKSKKINFSYKSKFEKNFNSKKSVHNPTLEDCVESNDEGTFAGGLNISIDNPYPFGAANDLTVPAGINFSLNQIKANIISDRNITSINVIYYSDNYGLPGTILGQETGLVPVSDIIIGQTPEPVSDIHEVVVNVPPFLFHGQLFSEKKYWIRLEASNENNDPNIYWQITPDTFNGNGTANKQGENWILNDHNDGVYSFMGDCLEIVCERINDADSSGTGVNISVNSTGRAANDIIIPVGEKFVLTQLTANILSNGDITSVNVHYYDDESGLPGGEIGTEASLVPISDVIVGNVNGVDVHKIVVNMSPFLFNGNFTFETTYWIELKVDNESHSETIYWQITEENILGNPVVSFGEENWESENGNDGVYKFSGNCYELVLDSDNCVEQNPDDTVDDALNIAMGSPFKVATDITIPSGINFELKQVTANILSDFDITEIKLNYYEDNNGLPGNQIGSESGLIPVSDVVIGEDGTTHIHQVTVNVSPVAFNGQEDSETVYWIELKANDALDSPMIFWQVTQNNVNGNPVANSMAGNNWEIMDNYFDAVYEFSGDCEIIGTPETGCLDVNPVRPQWPETTFVPSCEGVHEIIAENCKTGEYSNVQVTAGVNYIFSSSVSSDFITITDESGSVFLKSGTGSIVWEATEDQLVRFYLHLDDECNWGEEERSRIVKCGEIPITCESQEVPSYSLQDGIFFGGETNQHLAIDIVAGEQGFTLYGLQPTTGQQATMFNFILYEDAAGLPGNEITTTAGIIVNEEFMGSNFGVDFYKYTVKFTTPLELQANSRYWLEVQTDAEAWETSTASHMGNYIAFQNSTGGNVWAESADKEAVYSLICDEIELNVSDLNNFSFNYYPNPVNDILTIDSEKSIESISVFNLAGQKLLEKAKINQGKIDLKSLATGIYIFRVQLEGGQIETFKIIKEK